MVRICVLVGVVCVALVGWLPASAEGVAPRTVENMTRDIRFAPPFHHVVVAPSDPQTMYLADGKGYIYASKDGGLSWSENRVRVSRGRFVGAVRPAGDLFVPSSFYLNFGGSFLTPTRGFNVVSSIERLAPSSRIFDSNGLSERLVLRNLRNDPGPLSSIGGGGGGSALGVGLRKGSPWLTLALRKKRRWAVGLNIKQTLSLFASPPTNVYWLDVHSQNPDDVLAATQDGLLHSQDGGTTWATILSGATTRARHIRHVVRNPHKPNQIFAGSSAGLLVSNDNGATFFPSENLFLARATVNSINIHPRDPKFVVACVSYGMFVSRDGGETWRFAFRSPWPPQSFVTRVVFDAGDSKVFYFSTNDGLFKMDEEAKNPERVGGLLFVGSIINGLSSSGQNGHLVVSTKTDVWESFDEGENWNVVYFGSTQWSNRYVTASKHRPGELLVVTWAELLRLYPREVWELDPELLARYQQVVRNEPTSQQMIEASVKRAGVHRGDHVAYLQRSGWSSILPHVVASYFDYRSDSSFDRQNALIRPGEFVASAASTTPFVGRTGHVNLVWDLDDFVYESKEIPRGFVNKTHQTAEWKVRSTTLALYLERRRLQLNMLMDPRPDLRTRLMRNLRMEELTAHLNYLTGDLLVPYYAF